LRPWSKAGVNDRSENQTNRSHWSVRFPRQPSGLKGSSFTEVFAPSHKEFDLTQAPAVENLFAAYRPEILIHGAAVSGGDRSEPGESGRLFYENAIVGIQLLEGARQHGVEETFVLVAIFHRSSS